MSDSFTYDGVSSTAFGARVFPTDSMLKAPARKYDTVTVPGRSGALLMDLACYDNVQREYGVQIVGDTALSSFIALRNYLASRSGYLRLTDTFDATHYYMAAYTEAFNLTADWHSQKRGRGMIAFNCKPQRFLLSGETAVILTADGSIINSTQFASKPLLRVTTTRSAASVLGVGSANITIMRQGVTYIDCETGRAYNGATAYDTYVSINTTDFPALMPGSNGIALGTGISRVEITPRWWEL